MTTSSRYRIVTPEKTLARQTQKAKAFLDRALSAVNLLNVPALHRERICSLLGVGRHTHKLVLSDVTARIAAAEILYDVADRLLREVTVQGLPMFHITFVDDIGITSDRRPTLKWNAFKRKADKAIRAMGLSGIVMMEIQPLLNYPAKGKGRTLMLHAHALCWGPVSRRKFRKARNKLNNSRSWSNQFGAKPILSRRLKELDDALKIVCYLAKLPHDGKIRVPVARNKWRFKPTLQGYPNILALRIAEGLSHFSVFDAVFAVGNAKGLRREWKVELTAWHANRSAGSKARCFNAANFWRRARSKLGGDTYAPFKIE